MTRVTAMNITTFAAMKSNVTAQSIDVSTSVLILLWVEKVAAFLA